jgi:Flp pilus assembly protein TadG
MRMQMTRARRPRRRRGATAAELALILPLLVTVVLGCVDFGRFLYYYVGVVNSARAAAAYAIMNNYASSTQSTWTTGVNAAGGAEMNGMTGYDSTKLTITIVSARDANGLYRATVTASYPFKTIAQWPSVPKSMTMTKTVVMRSVR